MNIKYGFKNDEGLNEKIYLFLIFFYFMFIVRNKMNLKNSLNFSEDMDFEEFKIKVIEYAKTNQLFQI